MLYNSNVEAERLSASPLKNGRNLMPKKENSEVLGPGGPMLTTTTLEQQLLEMQHNLNITEGTGHFSRLGHNRISYVGDSSGPPNATVAHTFNNNSKQIKGKLFY